MPKGYLLANVKVTDPAKFDEYRVKVAPMIASFGGRYLVRGGKVQVKENDPGLHRTIILEFPTIEAAEKFYNSPEYAPLIKLRQEGAVTNLALIEGYEG